MAGMVLSLMAFAVPFLNSTPVSAVLRFLMASKALVRWATEDRLALAVSLVTVSELLAGTGMEAALVAAAMAMAVAKEAKGQEGDTEGVEVVPDGTGGEAGQDGSAKVTAQSEDDAQARETEPDGGKGTGQDDAQAQE